MSTWTPYKVHYDVENIGRKIKMAKQKVSFKFGFANQEKIKKGGEGSDCCGQEHEVEYIWSKASGKRLVTLDGNHIHFSETGENGWLNDRKFSHEFELDIPSIGVFECKIVSEPVNKATGQKYPTDLVINKISFFEFNETQNLGTPQMIIRLNGPVMSTSNDNGTSREDQKALNLAKLESMRSFKMEKKNAKQQRK